MSSKRWENTIDGEWTSAERSQGSLCFAINDRTRLFVDGGLVC